METAKIVQPLSGDKLYQRRARVALPILVRQAAASMPITYENLARELAMPNPRNLNYVLGSIGQTLTNLSKLWEIYIPPIQCLVVNKKSRLPGEGISWFITNLVDYKSLSAKQRRRVIDVEFQKIYTFTRWQEVLDTLGLEPLVVDFSEIMRNASLYRGGGEGKEHLALKEFVSSNPEYFALPVSLKPGEQEHLLPSGDSIDVFFKYGTEHIGIEVKPSISNISDITRGLFQCVKYQTILEARQVAFGGSQNVRTFLVLGGSLPKELLPLKMILGVEVFEDVKVR